MNSRDMLMSRYMRDGRNPYGSRGGYITHRDPRRRDRRRDYSMGYEDDEEDFARRGRGRRDYGEDYERRDDYEEDFRRGRGRDRGQVYPFEVSGMFGRYDGHHYDPYEEEMRRYGYDFASGVEYMSDKELHHKIKELMSEVEEKDKPMVKMENVIKRAKDLGVEFKKFSEEEFMATFLMVFTDYSKTLGTTNIDQYIRLAKDWLCDEDSSLKYGEKLAAYFMFVTDAE